mgnify:CR=1 FL=1
MCFIIWFSTFFMDDWCWMLLYKLDFSVQQSLHICYIKNVGDWHHCIQSTKKKKVRIGSLEFDTN